MTQLFVTVTHAEKDQSSIYSFDTFPVRIGRSASCHLSIGHQAVPRELCTAWIEPDGTTIRVEERPHLTTPLLRGRSRVCGGVSAPEIDLKVGPITLSFRAGAPKSSTVQRSRTKMIFYASAIVALVGLARICLFPGDSPADSHMLPASLPKTPFCADSVIHCDSPKQCERKARLAIGRARETLSHPGAGPREHIEAAVTLKAAAKRLALDNIDDARSVAEEAERIHAVLTRRYQRNVMALKEGLRVGNKEKIHRFARLVLEDIETCDGVSTHFLTKLIHETREAPPTEKKEDS